MHSPPEPGPGEDIAHKKRTDLKCDRTCIDYIFLFSILLIFWDLEHWSWRAGLIQGQPVTVDSICLSSTCTFDLQSNMFRAHISNYQTSHNFPYKSPRSQVLDIQGSPRWPRACQNYSNYRILNILREPSLSHSSPLGQACPLLFCLQTHPGLSHVALRVILWFLKVGD